MKYSKFLFLFLAMVTIGHINYSAQQSAYRLTQESYISPEMQWAILSFLGAQDVTISTRTGNIAGIPPVDAMMSEIRRQLQSSINFETKKSMKNALHAMLEATDIAIFVAAVEAAHDDQRYVFYQDIDIQLATTLDLQKKEIQAVLADLNAKYASDEPSTSSSYFSWFYPTIAEMNDPGHVPALYFDQNQESITFSKDMMEAIIKKNNYKIEQKSDTKKAANILFKQCFIAQQHHLKDAARIDKFKVHFTNPLTPENYFLHAFPDIDHACRIVENIVPSYPTRNSLEAPITQEQQRAHQLLLDVRQAIQTAMYIANDKSSYNVGYVLPTSVASYLGGIVIELTAYDTKLSALCKDPRFGATPDDTYRDEQWSTISKIAAGTLAATVIAGGMYFFAPTAAGSALASGVSTITNQANSLATGASNLMSNLWGSKPLEGPINENEKSVVASVIPSKWEQLKGAGSTVYDAGSLAAKVGGGVAFTTGIAQMADNTGYIPLNQLHPDARHYVDLTNKVSSNVAVIGSSATAIGSIPTAVKNAGTAYENLKNSESIGGAIVNTGKAAWDTGSVSGAVIAAGFAAQSAAQATQSLADTAKQIAGIEKTFDIPKNQQSPNQNSTMTIKKVPAEIIFEQFGKILAHGITAEGEEPMHKISRISQKLLQDKNTTPNLLIMILQQLEEDNAQNNVLAQQLGQLKQAVIHLQNQTLQTAQQ